MFLLSGESAQVIKLYCHVGANSIIRGVSHFGDPPDPIFLDNLACIGTESSLMTCPRSDLGLHRCDHAQDVGVECYGKSQVFP